VTAIGTVSALRRYPVKSLQGEVLDRGVLDTGGLDGDRAWGIVDTGTGHVLTAKRIGRLLEGQASLGPDGPTIELPDGTCLDGPGSETDAALSDWLGTGVTLRRAGDASTPYTMSFNVDDEDQDTFDWATPDGSFLDLAPVHLLTTAALAAAAAGHPDGEWSVHRFRPTLLIDTGDAIGFVENEWVGATLQIGGAALEVTMPTIRCAMPTRAQPAHSLERDLQIFKSLSVTNQQNLGAYADVTTAGTIEVGAPVELRWP
jgi:uncharacterized protein